MRRRRRTVRGSPAWMRRGVLAVVLLALAFFPTPGAASSPTTPACRGCRAEPADAQRWVSRLPGQWAAGNGAIGTVPASGQAYVAVGGGVAAVGAGLTVTGYGSRDGRQLWQTTLPGPAGAVIMSVRAWPGVVTVGVATDAADATGAGGATGAGSAGSSGRTRTEDVIDSLTGTVIGRYPAALFGGAVTASGATSVIIGTTAVTSYDNGSAEPRWRIGIGTDQAWRADGSTLYVAESAGGYLGSAPVTGLRVIDLDTGTERTLVSPPGRPFAGTMSVAADGAVLFTTANGVTAYSASTGGTLWSMTGVVPDGADPVAHLVYLTSASGFLVSVDPLTGKVKALVSGSTAPGSAGMYVVRGGVALGLDSGQGGEAWGYDLVAGRVTWTASALPWPHYFSDLSGLGGSASSSGDLVVVAACARLAPPPAPPPAPAASPSPTAPVPSATTSPSPTPTASTPSDAYLHAGTSTRPSLLLTTAPDVPVSPSASASPTAPPTAPAAPVRLCAAPELVALNV